MTTDDEVIANILRFIGEGLPGLTDAEKAEVQRVIAARNYERDIELVGRDPEQMDKTRIRFGDVTVRIPLLSLTRPIDPETPGKN